MYVDKTNKNQQSMFSQSGEWPVLLACSETAAGRMRDTGLCVLACDKHLCRVGHWYLCEPRIERQKHSQMQKLLGPWDLHAVTLNRLQ